MVGRFYKRYQLKLIQRELLGHGRLIGVRELLAELNLDAMDLSGPQYEGYQQKIQQSKEKIK